MSTGGFFNGESRMFPIQSLSSGGGRGQVSDEYNGLRPGDIPAWSSRYEYFIGREVLAPDGNYYRALASHTASQSFAADLLAGLWILFAGSGIGDLITGFTYNPTTGDLVLTADTSGVHTVNIKNIYDTDGVIGSGRVATITDTLTFAGGQLVFQDGTEGNPGDLWMSIDANGTGGWFPSAAIAVNIYNSDGTIGSGRVATITDTLTFTGPGGMLVIQDGTEGIPGYIWTSIDANGTGAWIPSPTASTNIYNADGSITDSTRTVTINDYLQFVDGNISMGGIALAGDRLRLVVGSPYDGAINISSFNVANNGYGILIQGGSSGANYSGILSDANGGATGINRGGFFGAGVSGPQENYGIVATARNGSVFSVGVYASATGGDAINPSEFAAGLWANVGAMVADDRRCINATIVEATTVNNGLSYGMKFEVNYISVVTNETVYGVYSNASVDGAGVTNTAGYFFANGGSSINNAIVVPASGGYVVLGAAANVNGSLVEVSGDVEIIGDGPGLIMEDRTLGTRHRVYFDNGDLFFEAA